MGSVSTEYVFQRFLREARNSSHFVWFLAGFKFFETETHLWVFGYRQYGSVTVIALEPLMDPEYCDQQFDVAWKEFCAQVNPKIVAFIGIYEPLTKILQRRGFQTLRVGQEPWIDLSDCIPKGNAGKGVRSARNQAIRAGLKVEEWTAQEIAEDPSKRETIETLFAKWKSKRVLQLSSFLNSSKPLAFSNERRYFVVLSSKGQVEGYQIATPIGGIQGYFLEDLILRPGAARGAGELVTLETLVSLGESGSKVASLGVVMNTEMSEKNGRGLPKWAEFFLIKLPKAVQRIYNFDGLETFRKRFKPRYWGEIHVAVKNLSSSENTDNQAWLKTTLAVWRAFKPKLSVNRYWVQSTFNRILWRHPISYGVALVSLLNFALLNHWGSLPEWALVKYGFSASMPFREWLFRSVVSDFLYFGPEHFWIWASLYVVVLRWAEKTHKLRFLIPFFILTCVLDDFVNYLLIIRPFSFLEPSIYHRLIQFKDVGGSLGLVTFFGLQFSQLKKYRELAFAFVAAGIVFGFVFSSLQFHVLVLNLNHFLFLTLGYAFGKVRFEVLRKRNREASKGAPPEAKCVAPR